MNQSFLSFLSRTAAFSFLALVGAGVLTAAPTPDARLSAARLSQNTHTVTGTVKDAGGYPLPGVTVRIKDTKVGTMTNADGAFKLNVPSNMSNGTLVFSFVGMKEQEVTVKFGESTAPLSITMREDTELLEEVVVTGYQTISKERATGSFAMVNEKDLKAKVANSILPQLEGKVPGLIIGSSGEMAIRGQSTIRGVTAPLIVVDGMPYEGLLTDLNPALIKDVTVLKDAAAASIYGARAANGVVVVRTNSGEKGRKTRVNYQGNLVFNTKPNVDDLHLMSTREMLELNKYGIQFNNSSSDQVDPRRYTNPFTMKLLQYKEGTLSEAALDQEIDRLSGYNNLKELSDFYYRPGFNQQHTVALSGGSDKYGYAASIDFETDDPNDRFQHSQNLGFSLRNNIKFFDWFTADLGLYGQYSTFTDDLGVSNLESMLGVIPSFQPLRNPDAGEPTYVPYGGKSLLELERLRDEGLLYEFYNPILNKGLETRLLNSAGYRANLGLNFDLTHGLNLELRYQGEWSYDKRKDLYDAGSFTAMNMVNNAAIVDPETGDITYNVPTGGQMSEGRDDLMAYTLRAQLNYRLETGDHYFTALAGAEARDVKRTGSNNHYLGYDDTSLGNKSFNGDELNDLYGTEDLSGHFSWAYTEHNFLSELEDRYVSFYANASYSYLSKYDITGSIRIDQSNLFGTDPKFQYRPLWSLGGSWHLHKEGFMDSAKDWLPKLSLRLTYGIGGNVPKDAGPYLTLYAPEFNGLIGDFGSEIQNPPNPTLRWEKTATTNIGIDFGLFDNLLYGSFDFYYKYTTDLLADRQIDPTNGFTSQLLNYGTLRNRGYELGLYGNFGRNRFRWNPALVVSINENKLIDVEDDTASAFDRTRSAVNVKGNPANSLFSYRSAGLNPETGLPQYYDKDGNIIEYVSSIDDLVYSGAVVPTTNIAFTNQFSYKGLSLSFMLTYDGGHVFRTVVPAYLSSPSLSGRSVEYLNVWKKPGDEKIPGMAPAYTGVSVYAEDNQAWQNSDNSILKADIIKLRDLTLSYTLPAEWLKPIHAQSLRIMLQGQNLFAVGLNDRGINPENVSNLGYAQYGASGYVYTPSKVFSIGLSLGF